MASEFTQKIGAIRADLDTLLQSVSRVDAKVKQATDEFERMADQADDIQTLTTALGKLNRLLADDKSPLLDRLRSQVELIAAELRKLDDKNITKVTKTFEAQANALSSIASSTRRLGIALESTSRGLASLSASLEQVKNSGADVTLKDVAATLSQINNLTNVKQVMSSITNVKDDKIKTAIASLQQLRQELKELNAAAHVDITTTVNQKRTRQKQQDTAVDQTAQNVTDPNAFATSSPSSPADQAQATIGKLDKHGRAIVKINRAIEAVELAQVKILKDLLEDAGHADKLELAKQAFIRGFAATPKGKSAAFDEFLSSVPNAARISKVYQSKAVKTNVPTDLGKGFEEVNLSDDKLIAALYRIRTEAVKKAEVLSKATGGDNAQASVLSSLQSFSASTYRPISYGVTEFGAFMNGIMSTLRGIKVGGITGLIDSLGGAFKSLHALNNAGAYFGVPLLPAGLGNVFNKKRSDTLLDVAEVGLNLSQGTSRTGDARRVRELEYAERRTTRQRDQIKDLLSDDGLSDANKGKLKSELDSLNKELKDLRASVRAYNTVMKDEAEREAKQGPHAPLGSTGQDLAQASVVTAHGTYERQMEFAQSRIAQEINKAKYLSPSDFRQAYSGNSSNAGNIDADLIGGFYGPKAGVNINTGYSRDVQQGVLYHEATHAYLQDSSAYADNKATRFSDRELERLRREAQARSSGIQYQETGNIFSNSVLKNAQVRPDYAYEAGEIHANVNQALLTGNKKLEAALRETLGSKLFDKVAAQLRTLDPAAHIGAAEAAQQLAPAAESVYTRIFGKLKSIFGPIYDTISGAISNIIKKVQEYLKGSQGLGGAAAQASILITSAPDANTGITRGYKTPDGQSDLLTQLITRFEPQINAAIGAVQLAGGGDFGGLLSGKGLGDVAKGAAGLFGIDTKPITTALGVGGAGNLIPLIVDALTDPAKADFKALGNGLKGVNLSRTLESFFKEQFNLKAFTGKEILDQVKGLNAPVLGLITRPLAGRVVSDVANSFNADDPNVDQRSVKRGNFYKQRIIRGLIDQFAVRDVDFEQEFNEEIRSRTGRNIRRGSYSQQANYDPGTGMTKFTVNAQTADGAMVSLNAHVDEFGRKKIDDPASGLDAVGDRFKRFITDIPNQLIQQVTYSITNGIQQMAANLISVQDELAEVANLYGAVGDKAETVKEAFLSTSVGTAIQTGQGFQEAVTTNLKNFKLLGAVQDPGDREKLSNRLSTVQLGTQTAFGVSLEQSLESIPAILSDITAGMTDIDDPVQRTTAAIQELEAVMDTIVVAQRTTGASGDELLTVYSRLAASAKQYGLASKDLIALTATGAVSIGKGESETSNILRSFLEGTYSQANESQLLKDFGIATKVVNNDTGQIENRKFTEVLDDIVKFTEAPETKGRTSQLLQVFAGPKPAGDIGKFIRGYATDFTRTRAAEEDPAAQGGFQGLVSQKLQNYQGSINKLSAAGTELFSSFLVGAGVIDKLTNFLEKMSQAASKLSGFIKDNKGAFQLFINVLTPNIIDKMTTGLLGTINVFTPFVKILGSGQTALRNVFSSLLGFDKVSKPIDKVNLTLRGLVQAIEVLEKTSGKASGGVVQNFARIATGAQQAQASVLSTAEAQAISPGYTTRGPRGPGGNRRVLSGARRLVEDVSTAYNAEVPQVSGQARLPQRVAQGLGKFGDAAGSLVAPLAFDVLAGGLRTDNVVQNAGAAIAGGFIGAVTASPALGVFFYSIFGEIFERIDIGKFFHVSDKEADAFSEAFARKLRKAVNSETKEDVEVQDQDQRDKEQRAKAQTIAITRYGDIAEGLGVNGLEKQLTADSARSPFNRTIGGSSSDLANYRRLVVEGKQPEGLLDKYYLSSLNAQPRQAEKGLYDALGSDELRDLYQKSSISDPQKFLGVFKDLQNGTSSLLDRPDVQQALITFNERSTTGQGITPTAGASSTTTILESSDDLIKRLSGTVDELNTSIQNQRSVPYGLDTYSPLGTKAQALQAEFQPKIDASLKDTSKEGRERTAALIEEFERGKQALDSIPASLQVLIPLAEALGLATGGLEQKLYNIGSAGQGQLVQKFQPALEASAFNRQYDLKQRNVATLQASQNYIAKEPAVVKEVEALNKALGADKARYSINQAYLATLKEQTNVLLDQAGAIEKQQTTRKLISPGTAGTPAQFTPAGIFDTKGTTATELNNAIEFALKKQQKLTALNPEYGKEFAKDQFLLQSGLGFKGVTGVNQSFVQEYLQSQKQQSQAPLEDLSKLSDQELQATLDRARGLQGQAEKLDPSRVGKYDNERILILRKNNELLAQTGIGQEFLKLALQDNTKANDSLRGHFNLPSNYKQPTIFDYYDNGGKEKGDKNFPTLASQGLVPLSFAQQLAQQLINPDNGEKGANLEEITGTNQAGARPLFYPTPGTPGTAAIYEEVPPQIIPDSIKSDQNMYYTLQKYKDFKDRQIADFEDGINLTVASFAGSLANRKDADVNNIVDRRQGDLAGPVPVTYAQAVPVQADSTGTQPKPLVLGKNAGYDFNYGDLGGAETVPTTRTKDDTYTKAATETTQALGKLKDDTYGVSTTFNTTKDAAGGLISPLKASAEAGKLMATNVPTAMSSLNTGASTFAQVISNVQQKLLSFDLAQTLKNANLQFQVNINGQILTANAGDVTITNAGSQGTSTLQAGSSTKSGASGSRGR